MSGTAIAPEPPGVEAAGARDLEVHQFVPTLLARDAVGNHVLRTAHDLAALGAESRIWTGFIHPSLARRARPWQRFERARPRRGRRRLLLYQAASYSGGLADYLGEREEPAVVSYHNLTPEGFLAPYDGQAAHEMGLARAELRRLVAGTPVAVAASEFNAVDLREMGARRVHVIPPYLGPAFRGQPDRGTLDRLRSTRRGIDLLFVGRLSPNKGHADLVRLMAMIRAGIDPHARLFLVGSPGPRLYMNWLALVIERLAPESVVLTGPVPDTALAAYYAHADVFVCLSNHEGFGIPLVEAMRARVPVLAYDAGAVSETLAGAGALVRTRDPAVLAELVGRLAGDAELRDEMVRRQLVRAAEIESFPRGPALVAALLDALEAA
ncbi:MAG TPA: glycosyltransferase [Candidatus Dormibacteraeota bacterium]|nr:glycosyltransferase [Candidatus Dormibacteraeota bacterium]